MNDHLLAPAVLSPNKMTPVPNLNKAWRTPHFRNHKISESDSFEPHHSRCGWEASVVSQSLFISLCVNIHTLRCTYSNVLITECCSRPNGDVTKYTEHMHRYYLSKIRKILHSETHLALRVSDNGLRTCIRSVQNRPCFRDAGSNLKKKSISFHNKELSNEAGIRSVMKTFPSR